MNSPENTGSLLIGLLTPGHEIVRTFVKPTRGYSPEAVLMGSTTFLEQHIRWMKVCWPVPAPERKLCSGWTDLTHKIRALKLIPFLVSLWCLPYGHGQGFSTMVSLPGHARGIDVIETRDEGYLVTGHTMHPEQRKANLLLVKLDVVGKVVWQRELSDDILSLFGWSVLETESGYLVMGFSDRDQRSKPMVFRFDLAGKLLEQRPLPVTDQGMVWSITENDAHEYYGVGEQSLGDSLQHVWVFRFDERGHILRESLLPKVTDRQRAFYIATLPNNYLVVAGTSQKTGQDHDDVLISCYDTRLQLLWCRVVDIRGGRDVGHAVKTEEDRIYVYGYYEQVNGTFNPLIIQLDEQGNTVDTTLLSFPDIDIRIMNGSKVDDTHYLIGYARTGASAPFKVTLVACPEHGQPKMLYEAGEQGINTGYSIKRVSDRAIIMTGAITEEPTGTAKVLVKKLMPAQEE